MCEICTQPASDADQADVRFGSKADMCSAIAYVCFVPIADIVNGDWHRWTKLFIALLIGLPPLPAVYPAHTLEAFSGHSTAGSSAP